MTRLLTLALTGALLNATAALADEATIRKNLAERLPQLEPIEEVSKSPIPGLYEIRVNGSDIYYTDEQGNYLVQGNLIDTKLKRNVTTERIEKLTAIKFESLPLADAFTIVRGNGKRKLAVFEDPNCGYCKRFEKDLMKVNNVTIYTFLLPILSEDSKDKSKNIWCSKDKSKSWLDWMLRDVTPPTASCDTATLTRNVALAQKYKIQGTPTLVFADGTRVPGAIGTDQIEKRLN
jgi:thiol:disulfide interchange protein DsbC